MRDETAIEQRGSGRPTATEHGFVDVYGEKHPVVFDPRLRDAVSPFVSRSLWNKL